MQVLESINFSYSKLSGKQLFLFKDLKEEHLQSYINKVNEAKVSSNGLFNANIAQDYSNAIQDLEAKQAALLLSTQGLTNAQVAETLAVNESNLAVNYQAMADAGLLKARQSLTAAQAQQTLQTVLGTDADINAAMASLGLSAAAGAEETQTVKLTAKKLQEAVASGKLTQAQAQEIGMRTGVLISMNAQKAIFPQLIARMKAMAIAIKEQIALNIQWAMSNPFQALALAGVALTGVAIAAYSYYKKHLEEIRQETERATEAYKETSLSIDDYASKYKQLHDALAEARGDEEKTYEIKKQILELQTELNDKYGDEYGRINLVTDAYKDQTTAIKAYGKEAAQAYLNENEKGIRTAKEKMTGKDHYNLSYTGIVSFSEEGKALKEIAEKYEAQGVRLSDDLSDGTLFSIHLEADPQSAYDTINAFENDVREKAKEFEDEHIFDDILDVSSKSLNSAKSIIDDYGEIYKTALLSEIAADDGEGGKAQAFHKATEAVEAYNEAVLKSEDPYNDKNVARARQNLQSIQDELNGEDWEEYRSVVQEVFDEADTKLFDFNQRLQNDDSLKALAENLKGFTNLDLEAFNQTKENESFEKLKKSAEVSVEELIDSLVRLGYVQEKAVFAKPLKLPAFSTKSFTKLTEDLSSVMNVYQKFSDNLSKGVSVPVDAKSLEELSDEFGDVKGYDDFVTALGSSSTTQAQAEAITKDLISNYLDMKLTLGDCTSSQKKYVISQLESIGVTNAAVLVEEKLKNQEAELYLQNQNLSSIIKDTTSFTEEKIQSLLREAEAEGFAQSAIAGLIAQEIALNEQGLNLSSQIEELYNLAAVAGIAASSLGSATAGGVDPYAHGGSYDPAANIAHQIKEGLKEKTKAEITRIKPQDSGTGTGASSADKSSKEAEKDILSDLNSEMDKYQSKLKAVRDARETYNRHGRISLDQAQDILDADFKLLAAYGDEEAALESLGKAKLNEMQIQLARNAIHTINSITTEAAAVQYLAGANENLADATLDATEQALKQAVAFAKTRGDMQGAAAETILQGYQNGAQMLAQVDFSFDPSKAEKTAKNGRKYLSTPPKKPVKSTTSGISHKGAIG